MHSNKLNAPSAAWQFLLTAVCTLSVVTAAAAQTPSRANDDTASLDLSDYETYLPQSRERLLPPRERRLLVAYLDEPYEPHYARDLAELHFARFERARPKRARPGAILRSAILASYFLHRLDDLNAADTWATEALAAASRYLDHLHQPGGAITSDEERDAHKLFRTAFHFREGLRYQAELALLDEYANDPDNVYTAFANTAIHLWMGGESPFADPTVLYDFALGSYFSLHAIALARELEDAYLTDPEADPRFRMAAILGGFSALQRRWLAVLHDNEPALKAIDDEHRAWRLIHRSFHAFTVGIPFFEEPDNFDEGLFAVVDGFLHCRDVPELRTCANRPRFFFNRLGFTLTLIDFLLKRGDARTAHLLLKLRLLPDERKPWSTWDLGQEPWLHREDNLKELVALYQNDDPSDDPLHFQLRRKRWSTNTTTCQTCHQTQSKFWTQEEFNTVWLPPEDVATVGTWPAVSTTWYAELLTPGSDQ
jgi:hypothetical protein